MLIFQMQNSKLHMYAVFVFRVCVWGGGGGILIIVIYKRMRSVLEKAHLGSTMLGVIKQSVFFDGHSKVKLPTGRDTKFLIAPKLWLFIYLWHISYVTGRKGCRNIIIFHVWSVTSHNSEQQWQLLIIYINLKDIPVQLVPSHSNLGLHSQTGDPPTLIHVEFVSHLIPLVWHTDSSTNEENSRINNEHIIFILNYKRIKLYENINKIECS